jgi:hypothetical protein
VWVHDGRLSTGSSFACGRLRHEEGYGTLGGGRKIGTTGPNALHAGDKITVKFIPARNGSPLGFLRTVVMPDGRVIQISAGNPND